MNFNRIQRSSNSNCLLNKLPWTNITYLYYIGLWKRMMALAKRHPEMESGFSQLSITFTGLHKPLTTRKWMRQSWGPSWITLQIFMKGTENHTLNVCIICHLDQTGRNIQLKVPYHCFCNWYFINMCWPFAEILICICTAKLRTPRFYIVYWTCILLYCGSEYENTGAREPKLP